MPTKSLSLSVPDAPPYDRPESWFESFVGNHLLPIAERGVLRRFWFSRYGGIGHDKHIQFRFETDDLATIETEINDLRARFPLHPLGYIDYDVAGDIGHGERSRFLGNNIRNRTPDGRGDIAFDFLHVTARLFIDCLSGPDAGGYWELEPETASGFNVVRSMEQYHHLFCNMTAVPLFVVAASHPDRQGQSVLSRIQFLQISQQDPRWTAHVQIPVRF